VNVLGVRVCCLNLESFVEIIGHWIASGSRQFVTVTGMHGVMESQRDEEIARIHARAGAVTPDGMPLVWAGRRVGAEISRVYGPELLDRVLREANERGWRSFFFGGETTAIVRFIEQRRLTTPSLQIVGTYSPPFRALSEQEEFEIARKINEAQPDIVWVVLGTPKQERWMDRNRARLEAPVLIGIGAGVALLSGDLSQAPKLMRDSGFEWLYRLIKEPRRLWRRYLRFGPLFLLLLIGHPPRRWNGTHPNNGH